MELCIFTIEFVILFKLKLEIVYNYRKEQSIAEKTAINTRS